MSRIIRSLETREHAYVTCQLNPQDKRKIDVTLTDAGLKVLGDYSRHRVARILQVLRELDSDQQESLDAIIDRVRDLLRR